MAETDNWFDPPMAGADLPTGGPVKPGPYMDRPKMVPAKPAPPAYPGIEDRRLQDFGDWQGARYLDPTPFQHMKDEAWRLPPGSYLTSDLPPAPPSSPLSRALGSDELDRANTAMAALREGLARKAAQARKK